MRVHNPVKYNSRHAILAKPLGFEETVRMAMQLATPDREAIKEGFLAGKNHPSDIVPRTNLMLRFHQVPHLARAIQEWEQADRLMNELIVLAERFHTEDLKRTATSEHKIDGIVSQIIILDQKLTEAENKFSALLGEASRWLEGLLMILLILAVATVEGTGLFLTISFGRSLTAVLLELDDAALRVGNDDFSVKVPERSGDELGQLAKSLNAMIENLVSQTSGRANAEHASETKNLFLANMSHEIRTPLNAILGFSELLSSGNVTPEDRARYAKIIKRTGSSLTTIINDILDISKVEAEQIQIQQSSFSLTQLMTDLHILMRMRADEKGIDLQFNKHPDVPDWIQSDPSRLRQILANIIGNSIKFTENGSVKVDYRVNGSEIFFTVEDTGGGIPLDLVDRLFKPFSQGDDSVQKKFGGTGLGLMISQRLAQLLGGDVGLMDNRPHIGSTFFVKIRFTESDAPEHAKAKGPTAPVQFPQSLNGRNILVVEDSKDNQLLADLFLREAGAKVDFADNGQLGVAAALQMNYDLILMDIQMPVMDGYSATAELRKLGCRTPIIALTGYAMKEDQDKCLRVGCDAYLSKPFDRSKLVHSVSSQLFT